MKKNIVTLLSVLTLSAAVLAGCGEAADAATCSRNGRLRVRIAPLSPRRSAP